MGHQLSVVGADRANLSKLELTDSKGRVRIALDANAADGPTIQLLDPTGRVVVDLNGDFNRGEISVHGPKSSKAAGYFRAGKKKGVGVSLRDPNGEAFIGMEVVTQMPMVVLAPKDGEPTFLPPPKD